MYRISLGRLTFCQNPQLRSLLIDPKECKTEVIGKKAAVKNFNKVLVVAVLALSSLQAQAFADSDPFPGVATGGEIPGTRVLGQQALSCPSGSGSALEVNVTTKQEFTYCVKTWRPSADVNADANFRAAQDAAVAAATVESQAWNAANPGRQRCVQWGPIVHANGVSTASGGVCANPVSPGAGSTVPSQTSDAVVGPSSAPTGTTSSTPATIPTNETPITGNGSPYTKILPGQLSTEQCPAGFQAANGVIAAIGTGTFTECWPELAWKANRLGGTHWEQFKSSGGTYDVTAVLDALAVIADYKAQAKAIAQTAANLTPGVQRCSTWSVYGQSGEECAYAFIEPSGGATTSDSSTVRSRTETATATINSSIDTTTAQSLSASNLDTSTAAVALVPVVEIEALAQSQSSQVESATPVVVTADMTVRQLKNKVVIDVEANVEMAALTIVARNKSGRTIVIPLTTNSEGERTLSRRLNLTGFTLTLKSGDQNLDRVVVKR